MIPKCLHAETSSLLRAQRLKLPALFLGIALWGTVLPLCPASAKDTAPDPILKADELIAEQEYDQAILYLTEFIKLYPDRFDEAQNRLRRVIGIREAYNQYARALIDVLVNDPTNEEKKLAMLKRLEELERNPNPETKTFVENTKTASLFVYNAAQFNAIMAKGRTLIDSGKYSEAAALYIAGFKLYRDEFDSGSYSELTKQSVSRIISGIEDEAREYGTAQAGLAAAVQKFQAALASGDAKGAAALWPAAEEALTDRAERRDRVVRSGRFLQSQFSAIQKLDPAVTDSSFLPFAYRFTLGRTSAALPEGVSGAMDSQWIALMNGLESSFEKELDSLYSGAEAAYAAGRWQEAADAFDRTSALAGPGLSMLSLWGLAAPTDIYPTLSQYGRAIVTGKSSAYERARLLALAAAGSSRLAKLQLDISKTDAELKSAQTQGGDSAQALAMTASYRRTYSSYSGQLEKESTLEGALAEELGRWTDSKLADSSSAGTLASYKKRIDDAAAGLKGRETQVASMGAGIEYSGYAAIYGERSAAIAKGRSLLEGQSAPQDGTQGGAAGGNPGAAGGAEDGAAAGTAAPLSHQPTAAIAVLSTEKANIEALSKSLADFEKRLAGDSGYIAASDEMKAWRSKAEGLATSLAKLETERAALLQTAQEQKIAAQAAAGEGDRRLSEARTALKADDFDTARSKLEAARERYLASLSLEDDAALRSRSDAALQELGDSIVKNENDKVVRDTRKLITDGKNFYFSGVFAKSEDSLLKAQARWKTTHADEANPEVEYWLKLAQSALSVKSGRDIPVTAPLYPEMSQLLSLANKYYEDGQKQLKAGQRTEALKSFDLAKEKINQVKVVFPLNQDASVLALRIDQIVDPATFRLSFDTKYNEAKSALKTNPRDAYSQLQDLSAINPNYPGLKQLMYDTEITLGLRMPPPDPAKTRRAASLIAAARRIVESGDTGRFSYALDQLNEAIDLNPNSEDASALRDRILTYQGGNTQIVLSSYAEEQYRQAVQLFQDGNYLQANAIVQRLLTDPKNKRSQKILDLSKKILARL